MRMMNEFEAQVISDLSVLFAAIEVAVEAWHRR